MSSTPCFCLIMLLKLEFANILRLMLNLHFFFLFLLILTGHKKAILTTLKTALHFKLKLLSLHFFNWKQKHTYFHCFFLLCFSVFVNSPLNSFTVCALISLSQSANTTSPFFLLSLSHFLYHSPSPFLILFLSSLSQSTAHT